MNIKHCIFPGILCLLCASALQSRIIHVPSDSTTIQAGINGAVDGDTVEVAEGTYTGEGNRDIDFVGKAIVVMSQSGWESCTIDCENERRGFFFHSGEDSSSVLQGFKITHGSVRYGGGILCMSASPTIRDNAVYYNYASTGGGGIVCYNCSPLITGNTITWNSAYGENVDGGGILCYNASPLIQNNTIMHNTASCTWDWEHASGGGIVCFESSSPTIIGCTIAENWAYSGDWHNYCKGGGILSNDSSPIIISNTITHNSADMGPGIDFSGTGSLTLTNSIVYMNSGSIEYPTQISPPYGPYSISYCDVESTSYGGNNIDTDPMYIDNNNDDFRLHPDSPCIDSGDPDSEVPPLGGDRVDMGALEYQYREGSPLILSFENTPSFGSPGESIAWDFSVENTSDGSVVFDGWLAVSGPNNSIPDSILEVTIPPDTVLSGKVYMHIPPHAPLGSYTVKGRIGILHQMIWDGEVFDVEIVEGDHRFSDRVVDDRWAIMFELTK